MTFKSSLLYALRIIKPDPRSVSNGRKSLFGAVFGVALSLVPLIVVLVVADGMIDGIMGRMVGLSSYHIQVVQSAGTAGASKEKTLQTLKTLQTRIQTLEGVTGAFLEKRGVALAAGKSGRSGAAVRAVDTDIFERNNAFKSYVELLDGQAAFPSSKSAVIGKKMAEKLNLHVGDTLRLIGAKTLAGGRIAPKLLNCKVSGIVSSGYEEIDALWVFVPFETGYDFLDSSSSSVTVGIETAFPFSDLLTGTYRAVSSFLPAGFRVYRWSDINSSQYENYASTKVLLILIMFLILLIASVNISSALVMVVMERKKEIAILKSMGASASGISTAFLLTGLLCGAAGTLIGVPAGMLCGIKCNEILHFIENAVNLIAKMWYLIHREYTYAPISVLSAEYYLQTIPVVIPFFELFLISAGTLFLSAAVSVLPAARAGKEKPLHIIRKT